MLSRSKIGFMMVGGLLALGIVFGGAAAFAQTDETEPAPAETEEALPALPGQGRRGPAEIAGLFDKEEALADALGITVEELQAAQEAAHVAAIEQAVTDGLLTREQADQILEGGLGLGRGRRAPKGMGAGGNADEFLAEALGISLEELDAAKQEVMAAHLDAMVEADVITQEQADMMAAQHAVQSYIDRDAVQAAAQAAYEEAVAQALADGVITQAQADEMLSNAANGFGQGRGPGFGGRGHRGGGRGFPGGGGRGSGFAPFQNLQPDVTDTGLGA